LPLAYNKDMQEDKLYVFETSETLLMTLPVMAEMTAGLVFDAGRMRAAAEESFALATDVADYLVGKEVSFRDAHRIVGQLVRQCLDQGKLLKDLTPDELSAIAPEFDEGFPQVVDLDAAIQRKASYGGTAPSHVLDQLSVAVERLYGMRENLGEL
jgi:argininosuccinate lyase